MVVRETEAYCQTCKRDDEQESLLSVEQTFVDKGILRELQDILIVCQNEECLWTGSYTDYDQEHAISCPFGVIRCINTGCNATICRQGLVDHLTNHCIMRLVHCEHCKIELSFREKEIHKDECPQYPVICQHCNREDIPRGKLADHVDTKNGDCTMKMIACKYENLGCNEMVKMSGKKEHEKRNTTQHMDMLLGATVVLQNTVPEVENSVKIVQDLKDIIRKHKECLGDLTICSENMNGQIDRMKSECMANQSIKETSFAKQVSKSVDEHTKVVAGLQNKIQILGEKLALSESVTVVLNDQVEQSAQVLLRLQRDEQQDREMHKSLERKMKAQDRIIALKDVTLAENDLRLQSLETASYNGEILWKITDFQLRRNEAVSGRKLAIYSPCFYSSRYGYKMCARIYLNGDGMGKGNHVSLFFVIMKGSYDALLRWPFQQKITLAWLDQTYREDVVDAFQPDVSSDSFKRPINDMNIASGCPLFMPLSKLDSPQHTYVKNDTAFIKIIVDTHDLY
ncbi:TNF receptor-associated factor 2-like isoform X2 [Glandiceps talaboti]